MAHQSVTPSVSKKLKDTPAKPLAIAKAQADVIAAAIGCVGVEVSQLPDDVGHKLNVLSLLTKSGVCRVVVVVMLMLVFAVTQFAIRRDERGEVTSNGMTGIEYTYEMAARLVIAVPGSQMGVYVAMCTYAPRIVGIDTFFTPVMALQGAAHFLLINIVPRLLRIQLPRTAAGLIGGVEVMLAFVVMMGLQYYQWYGYSGIGRVLLNSQLSSKRKLSVLLFGCKRCQSRAATDAVNAAQSGWLNSLADAILRAPASAHDAMTRQAARLVLALTLAHEHARIWRRRSCVLSLLLVLFFGNFVLCVMLVTVFRATEDQPVVQLSMAAAFFGFSVLLKSFLVRSFRLGRYGQPLCYRGCGRGCDLVLCPCAWVAWHTCGVCGQHHSTVVKGDGSGHRALRNEEGCCVSACGGLRDLTDASESIARSNTSRAVQSTFSRRDPLSVAAMNYNHAVVAEVPGHGLSAEDGEPAATEADLEASDLDSMDGQAATDDAGTHTTGYTCHADPARAAARRSTSAHSRATVATRRSSGHSRVRAGKTDLSPDSSPLIRPTKGNTALAHSHVAWADGPLASSGVRGDQDDEPAPGQSPLVRKPAPGRACAAVTASVEGAGPPITAAVRQSTQASDGRPSRSGTSQAASVTRYSVAGGSVDFEASPASVAQARRKLSKFASTASVYASGAHTSHSVHDVRMLCQMYDPPANQDDVKRGLSIVIDPLFNACNERLMVFLLDMILELFSALAMPSSGSVLVFIGMLLMSVGQFVGARLSWLAALPHEFTVPLHAEVQGTPSTAGSVDEEMEVLHGTGHGDMLLAEEYEPAAPWYSRLPNCLQPLVRLAFALARRVSPIPDAAQQLAMARHAQLLLAAQRVESAYAAATATVSGGHCAGQQPASTPTARALSGATDPNIAVADEAATPTTLLDDSVLCVEEQPDVAHLEDLLPLCRRLWVVSELQTAGLMLLAEVMAPLTYIIISVMTMNRVQFREDAQLAQVDNALYIRGIEYAAVTCATMLAVTAATAVHTARSLGVGLQYILAPVFQDKLQAWHVFLAYWMVLTTAWNFF